MVLLIGGITLYKTFALYEEKKEFNVLRGVIPDFRKANKTIKVNGEVVASVPEEKYYSVEVSCNGAEGKWNRDTWELETNNYTEKKASCTLEFTSQKMNEYIMILSNKEESIEKIEHGATQQTPALTDYRYVGKNPNNYVYFGCEDNCTEDNLYRIIGVIPTQSSADGSFENRVKLIKATTYKNTLYYWTGNESITINDWSKSTLNTNILNKEYLNSIKEYQKYIDNAKWYLGGPYETTNDGFTIDIFYRYERSNQVYTDDNITRPTSVITKIGLMYPSDYGYATMGGVNADRNTCLKTKTGSWADADKVNCRDNDWLVTEHQHTITPVTSKAASYVVASQGVTKIQISYKNLRYIYPTFYLKESVMIKNGSGTSENPYKIM